MVNYTCPRCGYTINIKKKYENHLRRKKICENKISDDNLINEYIKYNIKEKLNNISFPLKTVQNRSKSLKIVQNRSIPSKTDKTPFNYESYEDNSINSDISSDSGEVDIKNNNFECKFCNKLFLKKDYLETHLKKNCKMLIEFNNIYEFNKKTLGKNIYKNEKNAGDIYIIQTDFINNDHYKIGITNNIKRRLGQYRCGSTYEPRLHYYIPCKDIRDTDSLLNQKLNKFNVKREIFKGNIDEIKNEIVKLIKKKFDLSDVPIYEPDIKLGDLAECKHCNKCFYTKKDLFEHFNICEEYKERLSKKELNKEFECQYCNKQFTRKDSLTKHLNGRCKIKRDIDNEKNEMSKMVELLNQQLKDKDKRIDELIRKTGNTTINYQQNNVSNNIKLLGYRSTDISHLSDKDFISCISHSNFCIPHLIKKIHFNPDKPENHNIYISNIKNNYAMIYDGDMWNLTNKDDLINEILEEKEIIIEEKLEEWLEKGKQYPEIMKKFTRYLEKKENDVVLDKIKDEVKLVLFNNRNLVKN